MSHVTVRTTAASAVALVLAAAPLSAQAGLFSKLFSKPSQPVQEEVSEAPDNTIAQRYIVTVDPSLSSILGVSGGLVGGIEQLLSAVGGGNILFVYQNVMQGATVQVTERQARLLESLPGVKAVEPDSWISTAATQTQPDATWGLDRVDQTTLPLDNQFTYPVTAGQGVNVYVLDTGIRTTHADFQGRASGVNFHDDGGLGGGGGGGGLPLIGDLLGLLFGGLVPFGNEDTVSAYSAEDCNGHGTHVASSAAGTLFGVAKESQVIGLRVLGCNGSGATSAIIEALDWMVDNAEQPAVANMSLGGGSSAALDNAVREVVATGIPVVVAAGNSNADACNGSPNRVAEAITVGSTDNRDRRSSFSNHGQCVDIMAPGSNITAAWHTGDTDFNTISGTSMASPHVAGAVALLLAQNPSLTPQQVAQQLDTQASRNQLTNLNGSPNLLLNVNP
ncbi:MAG: subtilase family serine protease [Marinobacter excellens HL-55]|uniref:Subtilase family serine protease n=1 Tax=Marinobacter excellens HL-55 TaxID=1305731 RepID=A0A0P7YF70_9GAMM|nr:MAG: subtilase family serine protease [Marinobacter excellens HL-55]